MAGMTVDATRGALTELITVAVGLNELKFDVEETVTVLVIGIVGCVWVVGLNREELVFKSLNLLSKYSSCSRVSMAVRKSSFKLPEFESGS